MIRPGTCTAQQRAGGYLLCLGIGCGVVWELSPSSTGWDYSFVHIFQGGRDGAQPLSGPMVDSAGNVYQTLGIGGNDSFCIPFGPGCGAVLEFTRSHKNFWNYKTLATFNGTQTGWYPTATMIAGATGNLYGTTYYGGTNDYCNGDPGGCGIVFKLSPKTGGGWSEQVLYRFHSMNHSSPRYLPNSGVVMDAAGNLYGTAIVGGSSTQCDPFGC